MSEHVVLTEARREALLNVATGGVHQDWPSMVWRLGQAWQPLRPQPYRWLLGYGLISLSDPVAGVSAATITEAGRKALAVTDDE